MTSVKLGRQRDVFLVTDAFYDFELYRNALLGDADADHRLTLPFALLLFGSGKTALMRNYLNLLGAVGRIARQKSFPTLSFERLLEKMINFSILNLLELSAKNSKKEISNGRFGSRPLNLPVGKWPF